VIACCWEEGNNPATCVALDIEGEPKDQLRVNFVNSRSPTFENQRRQAMGGLAEFIRTHDPHIVILAASPGEIDSRRFFDDLKGCCSSRCHVAWADTQVARIYRNSPRSAKEFPEFTPNARFKSHQAVEKSNISYRLAVSLGRYVQDPLMECAALLADNEEMLYLRLHPMQNSVRLGRKLLIYWLTLSRRCLASNSYRSYRNALWRL
jgi:hypothetical protein